MRRTAQEDGIAWFDENGKLLFAIRETVLAEELILQLEGSIVPGVAPAFEDELTAAVSVCGHICVDFAGVDAVSGGGMKALLVTQRLLDQRPGAALQLRGMKPAVYDTFAELGFDELFDIAEQKRGGR